MDYVLIKCHHGNERLIAWIRRQCVEFLTVSSMVFCPSDLSEAVLQAMQRSRRILFVLSPAFLTEKSFSLLECRLGLFLQHGHRTSIVAVVYRSVTKLPYVEVAQLRQAAVTTVKWRESRSEPRSSRFWLRLRLALPLRPLALGRRLIDSTSSHSDLAALALQRALLIQNQKDETNQRHRGPSANHSHRRTQAPPTGRRSVRTGGVCGDEGSQHCRGCPACVGSARQRDNKGAELAAKLNTMHDGTDVQLGTVPQTDPAPSSFFSTCEKNNDVPRGALEDT